MARLVPCSHMSRQPFWRRPWAFKFFFSATWGAQSNQHQDVVASMPASSIASNLDAVLDLLLDPITGSPAPGRKVEGV
eukprot:12936301-Prorocentrum_lima.AAC.1